MRKLPLLVLLVAVVVFTIAFYALHLSSPPNTLPDTRLASIPSPIPSGCGQLQVYVLNVSQADSIFIITPGNKTILTDAGSKMRQNSSSNVIAFLKSMNVSRIDYLIASHFHEDHIGGMNDVFTGFEVGSVYDNGNCANATSAAAKKFDAYKAIVGSTTISNPIDLPSDGCLSEAKLIFPNHELCSKSDENENSLLLHLVYGNTSFLFTGDCEEGCETAATVQAFSLKSDFLKVGHHGSATSSVVQFLDMVGAGYYAISVDKAASAQAGYFHPRQTTLEKLYSRSPSGTFRTDLNGDVKAVSDGDRITITQTTKSSECETFTGYASSDASSYSVIPEITGCR